MFMTMKNITHAQPNTNHMLSRTRAITVAAMSPHDITDTLNALELFSG